MKVLNTIKEGIQYMRTDAKVAAVVTIAGATVTMMGITYLLGTSHLLSDSAANNSRVLCDTFDTITEKISTENS